MKHLHNWVIHYNQHKDRYEAALRENYHELFSGDKGNVLASSSIKTLIEIIERTNGDKQKLKNLLK